VRISRGQCVSFGGLSDAGRAGMNDDALFDIGDMSEPDDIDVTHNGS
jgi:hypothetical protein